MNTHVRSSIYKRQLTGILVDHYRETKASYEPLEIAFSIFYSSFSPGSRPLPTPPPPPLYPCMESTIFRYSELKHYIQMTFESGLSHKINYRVAQMLDFIYYHMSLNYIGKVKVANHIISMMGFTDLSNR